ncbi:MAG: hypothetical protein ACYC2U_00215 [Candidatus Amoebophilus sp.]
MYKSAGRKPAYMAEERKAQEEKQSNKKKKDLEPVVTVYGDKETLRKIKSIAYWKRMSMKDVVAIAIKNYITHYEASKGPIKIDFDPREELLNL